MSAWAETTVKAKGNPRQDYPPLEGEECGKCRRELRQGERVFRPCGVDEIRVKPAGNDPWVCESCLTKGEYEPSAEEDYEALDRGEWPLPDDPPDPL